MREIKFRAFVSKENRYKIPIGMIQGEYIKTILEPKFTQIPAEWCWDECGLILMQFTGLTDKNGKEIYEGDIVKCPVTINKHIWGEFQNRVVKWKEDSFTWVFDSEYSWGRFEDSLTGEGDYLKYTEQGPEVMIEIVGNIYENPELLKQ